MFSFDAENLNVISIYFDIYNIIQISTVHQFQWGIESCSESIINQTGNLRK